MAHNDNIKMMDEALGMHDDEELKKQEEDEKAYEEKVYAFFRDI